MAIRLLSYHILLHSSGCLITVARPVMGLLCG